MVDAGKFQPHELLEQLNLLRCEMLDLEASGHIEFDGVHVDHRASATNLLHYLALRRHDIRGLQAQLAALGLSSLGRTESHVFSALQAVMSALNRLSGSNANDAVLPEAVLDIGRGAVLLDRNTHALFGPPPRGRTVRVMVTMPTEAAPNYELVRDLALHGMDCMRINCAHDGPEAWAGMIRQLHRAEKETGRPCKVAMDLAGPKLRTGPVEPGPAVLKFKPKRDDFGRVTSPARVWLTPRLSPEHAPAYADACIPVSADWLERLKSGDRVRFKDARGSSRSLRVRARSGESCWAESNKTCYIVSGTVFELQPRTSRAPSRTSRATPQKNLLVCRVGQIPPKQQSLTLKIGDTLILTRSLDPGQPAKYDPKKAIDQPGSHWRNAAGFFRLRAGW